ncbi:MAG: hypothetical protein QXM76_03765 [Zestosphaera sp.]
MREDPDLLVREWRAGLDRLGELLVSMVREVGLSDVMRSLIRRLHSASELLSSDRFKILLVRSEGGIAFINVGADEVRKHITKSDSSGVAVTYLRDFYITQVGPYGIKCTCDDALITSSRADSALVSLARALEVDLSEVRSLPITSRYVLCKHTLALTSLFTVLRVIDLEDPRLLRTLKLGVITLALREGLLTQPPREAGSVLQIVSELLHSE